MNRPGKGSLFLPSVGNGVKNGLGVWELDPLDLSSAIYQLCDLSEKFKPSGFLVPHLSNKGIGQNDF